MIKKLFLAFCLLCFTGALYGQYKISIVLQRIPGRPKDAAIYLAGDINNWSPADRNFMLHVTHQKYRITLNNIPEGTYSFKFTRGSWQSVECDANGNDISNREIKVNADTTLYFSIAAWKDQFPPKAKKHTMSVNVEIIDTAFEMPQLKRTRRIWVYLPPDYKTTHQRYAVLYMQDGQNLFDAATSAYGEWGVDEILDSLYQKGVPGVIVVGIDNGGEKRMNEYDPYDNPKYGTGEGKQYASFLVNTLKPFIDGHFRTLTDAAHTGIAGSSMGGLISFYTWIKYPGVFGKAGIFSPSFWIAPQIKKEIPLTDKQKEDQVYFIAGDAESGTMVADMKSVYHDLLREGMPAGNMQLQVVPGGRHSESYWKQEFPNVFLWLFGDQKK